MRKLIIIITLLLSACKTMPVIDTKGVNMAKYNDDLIECQRFADNISVSDKSVQTGITAAAVGAALGAILGGIYGDAGAGAAYGAASYGVTGAAYGAVDARNTKEGIVKRCMSGRGYKVLN